MRIGLFGLPVATRMRESGFAIPRIIKHQRIARVFDPRPPSHGMVQVSHCFGSEAFEPQHHVQKEDGSSL